MSNWVTIDSQTDKYVENISTLCQTVSAKLSHNSQQTEKYVENVSTPCDGKAKHARDFQIALKKVGEKSPIPVGEGMR